MFALLFITKIPNYFRLFWKNILILIMWTLKMCWRRDYDTMTLTLTLWNLPRDLDFWSWPLPCPRDFDLMYLTPWPRHLVLTRWPWPLILTPWPCPHDLDPMYLTPLGKREQGEGAAGRAGQVRSHPRQHEGWTGGGRPGRCRGGGEGSRGRAGGGQAGRPPTPCPPLLQPLHFLQVSMWNRFFWCVCG